MSTSAANAGLLAAQIIALGEPVLADKLRAYKEKMTADTVESDRSLQEEIRSAL